MTRGINIISPFAANTGYGTTGEYLALGFKHKMKYDVRVLPTNMYFEYMQTWFSKNALSDQFKDIFAKSSIDSNWPTIYNDLPTEVAENLSDSEFKIWHTMFETDTVPDEWVPVLNRHPVIVPSSFLIDTFRNAGVMSDIHVLPSGIDPITYHPIQRKEKPYFVFGIVGPAVQRKNLNVAIMAWKKLYKDDPTCFLHIQGSYGYANWESDHPNIIYNDNALPGRDLNMLYRDWDALIALGSEGLGLPIMEALATEMPVVAMNAAGQADICNEIGNLFLTVPSVKMLPLTPTYNHMEWIYGNRWVPGVDDVADQMKEVRDNYEKWQEKAKEASKWVIENRNIWNWTPKIVEVMDGYGAF